MKIAIIGVTGMVGEVMLKVLEERQLPISEIIPVASKKTAGSKIKFNDEYIEIADIQTALEQKPDVALFSAGSKISSEWAEKFIEQGCYVIDNSSAWRMKSDIKLIVPEVNGNYLQKEDSLIANPNCSTIQLVMTLKPLHDLYNIEHVVASTYQSVTGSGKTAISQLNNEREGNKIENAYPWPIDKNILPHCGDFLENGQTEEEMKLVNETAKIMGNDIKISATAARVPVEGGHSEALHIFFEKEPDLSLLRRVMSKFPGLKLQDNPDVNTYPMPLYAKGKDDVFVGRIRKDLHNKKALQLWVVSDNLRKGAATNAVQILETLIKNGFIRNFKKNSYENIR